MENKGQRSYELLKKIGFIRLAGSDEEMKAANILKAEIESIGGKPVIEEFPISDANIQKAELHVLAPYEKSYTVTAYKCCKNTEDDGLVRELVYVENMLPANLANVKDKIVLVNGGVGIASYKKLVKAGVAGFISFSGSLRDTEDDSDLFTKKMRATFEAVGVIPAVNLRISDAFEMVQKGACKVKMVVKNEKIELTSHNVIAEIKGTECPDEIISFGAHFDSVEFSTGVYDNGAGSVIEMELYRYFMAHPPKRTLKFMWYGSEEIGLEGSKAWVRMHEDELDKHIMMVNIDVAAPVLGHDGLTIIGDMSFVNFADGYMKLKGFPVEVKQGIYSSDSMPFSDKGIPALNFTRFGAPGAAFIHCRHDIIDYLSAEALEKTITYTLDFCDSIVNSVVFPCEKNMPKEMVEEIDKYLCKKIFEDAEKEKKN